MKIEEFYALIKPYFAANTSSYALPFPVMESIALAICDFNSMAVTDQKIIESRNKVLQAIPPCPAHGNECVPHALEWIAGHKNIAFALLVADGQLENAIAEERRWRLREAEACEMKIAAQSRVAKWADRINELKGELR